MASELTKAQQEMAAEFTKALHPSLWRELQ